MSGAINILAGGIFHAAVLFMVAAGLQIVFGVQKILNVACGSFYALGAYVGIVSVQLVLSWGAHPLLLIFVLICASVVVGLIVGPVVERALRFIYGRDEHFAILLTFALVLMIEDFTKAVWGTAPMQLGGEYILYGRIPLGEGAYFPVYNLIVILAAAGTGIATGWFFASTKQGRIIRATAENRSMSMALCINVNSVYSRVFTLGVVLGMLGGALVIPTTAATPQMGMTLVVSAFAVVIIGGLGSMIGALVGALLVGLAKAIAIATYAELELIVVYLIVVTILIVRPQGLFPRRA